MLFRSIDWGISPQDAYSLTKYPAVAAYFEKVCQASGLPNRAAKWMLSEIFAFLPDEDAKQNFALAVTPQKFGSLLLLEEQGELTHAMAKDVMADLLAGTSFNQALLGRRGNIVTEDDLETLCSQALEEFPGAVQDYLKGKKQAAKVLVGAVMRASGGRADPRQAQQRIAQRLQELE